MPKCFFCNHDNPNDVDTCQECRVELKTAAQPHKSAEPNNQDAIESELGNQDAIDPLEDELLQHLRAGRKIQAVKAYRERTGSSLKDAVMFIDAVQKKYGIETPSKSGCSVNAVALILLVSLLIRCLF